MTLIFNGKVRTRLWDEDDPIYLIHADDFHMVPDGTVLTSISGRTITKGIDNITDLDQRLSYLAFGIYLDTVIVGPSSQSTIVRVK